MNDREGRSGEWEWGRGLAKGPYRSEEFGWGNGGEPLYRARRLRLWCADCWHCACVTAGRVEPQPPPLGACAAPRPTAPRACALRGRQLRRRGAHTRRFAHARCSRRMRSGRRALSRGGLKGGGRAGARGACAVRAAGLQRRSGGRGSLDGGGE